MHVSQLEVMHSTFSFLPDGTNGAGIINSSGHGERLFDAFAGTRRDRFLDKHRHPWEMLYDLELQVVSGVSGTAKSRGTANNDGSPKGMSGVYALGEKTHTEVHPLEQSS